ncbi:hypothetical protein [Rhizobium sp. Leaf453]|uniref:hypothetical protein n=1 Tax=Rhizobium sp. Leaf453 TaxID=1736380 RepID=UPI0012E3A727|nr:hypothetical protein [Rhizobium sp. Leaf453]
MADRPPIAVNFRRRAKFKKNTDEAAKRGITAISFKGAPGEEDQKFDLSDVAVRRPQFATAFCLFLEKETTGNSKATRGKLDEYLRNFIEFLDSYEATFGVPTTELSQLATATMRNYGDWLDGNRYVGSTLKLSDNTKNTRYNFVKRFVKYCQSTDHWRDEIPKSIVFRRPWVAKLKPPSSRNSLSIIDIKSLRKACKAVIDCARVELDRATRVVNDATIRVPDLYLTTSVVPFHDPQVRLKAAAQAFEVNRLSGSFRTSMRGLARALRKPYGETSAMISQLYFTTETLLPFMVLTGLATCFNATGLVKLRRENVKRGIGILGDERIFVIGEKPRAGRNQRRSFPVDSDDPYSVASLLDTVVTHTEPLRRHVDPRYADSVFIAARTTGERPSGYFDGNNNTFSTLEVALSVFLKFHDLPHFTINDLRTIGADVASMMSEGEIKVQQIVLQHESIQTTMAHYQTEQAARARQEQLAHLMNERDRFISSGGRIDPRNKGASAGLYRAATPGFDCLDAMNSPIVGQRQGTLCSAYGKCFRCPRAVLFPTIVNAARLLQMYERFLQARDVINPARWIIEWAPQLRILTDFWLAIIPVHILADARALELPPVPSIE